MKLSNSVRGPQPLGSRRLPETPRAPKNPPNPIPDLSPLAPAEAESKRADTFPPPPLRKGDEVGDQGHHQPTRQPSGVAVGDAASTQPPIPCQTLFPTFWAAADCPAPPRNGH